MNRKKTAVLLLDAMCEVKALQKKPGVNKMKDLKKQFIKKIDTKSKKGYVEMRILFDPYQQGSGLKDKTQAKRAQGVNGNEGNNGGYDIHDEMDLKKVSIASLLSCRRPRQQ